MSAVHVQRFLGVVLGVVLAVSASSTPAVVVDFQGLPVPAAGYFNGDPGGLAPGQSVSNPWAADAVRFSNTYGIDGDFAFPYWFGFAYSNVVNTTDPAFTNQYASFPGGGYQSTTYAVAYADGATITLPLPATVSGCRIANTTYAALTMRDGDAYGFTTPLPAGGWFSTTATGKLGAVTTGSATFALADLRGGSPPGILATWDWFDLAPLGTVDRIEFTFDGSDKGVFGLNTPAYFAMDDLTVSAVPEPATSEAALVAAAAVVVLRPRRTRRDA
ncbi:MAG: DUF4465 domain-containing protein [Planctomycetaceae bacterium]